MVGRELLGVAALPVHRPVMAQQRVGAARLRRAQVRRRKRRCQAQTSARRHASAALASAAAVASSAGYARLPVHPDCSSCKFVERCYDSLLWLCLNMHR